MAAGTNRPWASAIDSATMRKRSKLFVDGRLVLFPGLIILCGVLFVHGVFNSFCFVLLGVGLYLALRAQFAFYPWLIDDFQSEMAFPYELPDVGGRRDN
jgi:hypothetical protein